MRERIGSSGRVFRGRDRIIGGGVAMWGWYVLDGGCHRVSHQRVWRLWGWGLFASHSDFPETRTTRV